MGGTTRKPNGAAVAALLAAAIGMFAIGLLTTLAAASAALKGALNWWNPVGPLTGKTGLGVIVWLVAWAILHARYKEVEVDLDRAVRLAGILILLGLLGTFPPFFEAFGG